MASGGPESRDDDEMDALLAAVAAAPPVHTAGAEDLLIGRLIGRFRVVAPLGKGGMGVVYRARDPQLERDVALKVMAPSEAADPDRRARFLREARAAARLSHASIAAIHDVGFDEGAGVPYIAMELVEGQDLRKALANGAFSVDEALRLALQVAGALARAHGAGIVHRDLKPENVMLTVERDVKVLDFGLAKRIDANTPRGATTQEGMVLGTPGYMAPEQVLARPVDARADVFAFGVLLQEMLTGKAPFVGDTPMVVALAVTRDAPLPIERSDVPAPVRTLIARCLEKEPSARFADGGALVQALGGSAPSYSGPNVAPPSHGVAVSLAAPTPAVALWSGTRPAPAQSHRPARAMLAAALVALVAIVAIAALAVGAGAIVFRPFQTSSNEPISLASIPIVSPDADVQAAFRSAVLAFYDGDTSAQTNAIESVLTRAPDTTAAWLLKISAPGDGFAAIKAAHAAASRAAPSPAIADALVALESVGSGGVAPAIALIDSFVVNHPREYFLQALLLAMSPMGATDRWRADFAARLRALDDGPAMVTSRLAVSLRRMSRTEEALQMIDAALLKRPDHPELVNQKAQMLQTLARTQEAIDLMEGVLRQRPADRMSRYLLLDLYLMTGDDDARRRHITAIRAGTWAPADVAAVLTAHGMQLMGRSGRLAEGDQMFDAAAEAAIAGGLWPTAAMGRAWQIDYLTAAGAADRSQAVSAQIDRLMAAPEVPEALRKNVQLVQMRAELGRHLVRREAVSARALLTRMEALDESYFYLPRRVLIGRDRAFVLALEGNAAEAHAAFATATVEKDKEVLADIVNATGPFVIARLLNDKAGMLEHGKAVAALADVCLALQSDDKLWCRSSVVTAAVVAAEEAHTAGDVSEARRLLELYERIWPATADAPMAVRARALRAIVGKGA